MWAKSFPLITKARGKHWCQVVWTFTRALWDFGYTHNKANSSTIKCFSSRYNQWFCLSAKLMGLNPAHLIMQMLCKALAAFRWSLGHSDTAGRTFKGLSFFFQRECEGLSYWSPSSGRDDCNQCLWRMTERDKPGKHKSQTWVWRE